MALHEKFSGYAGTHFVEDTRHYYEVPFTDVNGTPDRERLRPSGSRVPLEFYQTPIGAPFFGSGSYGLDGIPAFNEFFRLQSNDDPPLLYFEQCHAVLAEIRKKGVHIAVDDFGAGYSNLRYISDLTPDIVKFDRELVAGIREGSRLYRLMRSLVRLCKEMGAKVVAEGIETVDELAAVETARVDFAQGYLLARPGLPLPTPQWPAAL